MFQVIDNTVYYIVDFDVLPKTPVHAGFDSDLIPYALALTKAIDGGIITKPGKYAIYVNPTTLIYGVYEVQE